MRRTFLGVVIALAAMLLPVAAGNGWAVTTLDTVPINVGTTEIVLTHATSNPLKFAGVQTGPTGHYVAKVTMPRSSGYAWAVTQGQFESQPLRLPQPHGPDDRCLRSSPAAAPVVAQQAPLGPLAERGEAVFLAKGCVGCRGIQRERSEHHAQPGPE